MLRTGVRVVKGLVGIRRFSVLCAGNSPGCDIMACVVNGEAMNRRRRRRMRSSTERKPSGGLLWWMIAVVVVIVLVVAVSRIL